MKVETAIAESIQHWKRMIEWVEKRDKKHQPSEISMWTELKEDWGAESCPLCKQQDNPRFQPGCPKCPLALKYGLCSYIYLNALDKNAWPRVTNAQTWKDWLKHAKQLLIQLESLL